MTSAGTSVRRGRYSKVSTLLTPGASFWHQVLLFLITVSDPTFGGTGTKVTGLVSDPRPVHVDLPVDLPQSVPPPSETKVRLHL